MVDKFPGLNLYVKTFDDDKLKEKFIPNCWQHDHAIKVTGMLLEMDQTELLHLPESLDVLKAKVDEGEMSWSVFINLLLSMIVCICLLWL